MSQDYTTKENFKERLLQMDKHAERYGFKVMPKKKWKHYRDEEFGDLEIYRIYGDKRKRYRYLCYVMVYHFKQELKEPEFQEPSVTYVDGGGSGNDSFWYWADGSEWERNYGEED